MTEVTQIENFLSKKVLKLEVAEWLLILIITVYSITFSFYTVMRFYSFRCSAWDLGTLVQSISSALKGKNFINNVEIYYCATGSYFGVHFSPILFILVPFFYLMPKTETIIILQTIILGLTSVPIYLIAKRDFQGRLNALTFSIAFLFNPLLQGLNWCDFTPQTFFPLFILSATYFLKIRKPFYFLIFLIFSLLTMEQASYFIIFYTPFIARKIQKNIKESSKSKPNIYKILPPTVLVSAIIWIIFSSIIKYTINPTPPEEIYAIQNFKVLGAKSIPEIPAKVVTDINALLKALNYDMFKKTFYILITFAPSCFLAFLSPIPLLPAILWLFIASISNWPPYYMLGLQYTAFTLPFVTIATLETINKIRKFANNHSINKLLTGISLLLLCANGFLLPFNSPLSPIHKVGEYMFFKDYGITYPSKLDFIVRDSLSLIPQDATVITTHNLFPHIANNIYAYVIPPQNSPSEKLYLETLNFLQDIRFDYIVLAYYYPDKTDAEILYDRLISTKSDYGLFIYAPGLEIYKKSYLGTTAKLSAVFTHKELFTIDGLVVDDVTSDSGKVIKLCSSGQGKTAWFGPYTSLEPGNYIVKFKFKTNIAGDDKKIITLDVYSHLLQRRLAFIDIYGKNIAKSSTWYTFTIQLYVPVRIPDAEFRGVEVADGITVILDYIEVTPITLEKYKS